MKIIVGGELYDTVKDDTIIIEITDELRNLITNAAPEARALLLYNEDVLSKEEAERVVKEAKMVFDES